MLKRNLTHLFFLVVAFTTSITYAHSYTYTKELQNITSITTIKVGLFYGISLKCMMVAPHTGSYTVILDGKAISNLPKDFVLQLTYSDDLIDVKSVEESLGKYKKVVLVGCDSINSLKVKSVTPEQQMRVFDDNFEIGVEAQKLKVISDVNIDKYVSSVVQSEVGTRATLEYYKLQSIICRTYVLGHTRRHETEGFNVCDQVHCQVDHGNARVTPTIKRATVLTSGLVMIGDNMEIALAAFHSNCGGQTVNSEEVWNHPKKYLCSVSDINCLNQAHANWEKKMPIKDWLSYLNEKYKYNIVDSLTVQKALHFEQTTRKINFSNEPLIPLKNIRNDLNLKSTFFTVNSDTEYVYIIGKGYGHGVGLCQEGAMQMAKQGISYKDILKYYYKNINLINLNQLSFFSDQQ